MEANVVKLAGIQCCGLKNLAIITAYLAFASPWQLLLAQTTPQTTPGGQFDGTYVPDRTRGSGGGLLAKTPPCRPTQADVFGQGLTVTNSVGTFLVGVQPQTFVINGKSYASPKIKPAKASGRVDSTGHLTISQGKIKVEGRFDGPANGGSRSQGPLGPEGICGALPDTSTRRLRSSHWRAEYRSVP